MSDPTPQPEDYQDRDIRLRPLVLFLVGAAVITALSLVGGKLLLSHLLQAADQADRARSRFSEDRLLPPSPLLQVTPSADLAEHRAKEEALLHQYEWIDKSAGTVRIPVERAMELMAIPPDKTGSTP